MNSSKKIFTAMILTTSLFIFAHDENQKQEAQKRRREQEYAQELQQAHRSATIWAGVAGFVGAAAGAAIGSWIANCESDKSSHTEIYHVEQVIPSQCDSLSPRARYIKSQLDSLSKYGQVFDLRYDTINESALILNLYKLGFALDQIDNDFYDKLAQDNKVLSDAGYSIWWHGLKNLEYQKDAYLTNSHKIIAYFNQHQNFIRSCQIINHYNALPSKFWNMPTTMIYPARLPNWIKDQFCQSIMKYPLLAYASIVEANKNELVQLQQSRQMARSILADRMQQTYIIIDSLLLILYGSFEYQQEVELKKQEELFVEYRRIEEEKLEIARKQNELLEQANRLAAEKNRIEHERYRNYRNDRY